MSDRTLFAYRPLANAEELIAWAKEQGFPVTMEAAKIHCTQIYSKTPCDWGAMPSAPVDVIVEGGDRSVSQLGDQGAVVLKFESPELSARWDQLIAGGAVSDYESFTAHCTITWDGAGVDLEKVSPFSGALKFGPERFEEIDESWKEKIMEKRICNVCKVDEALGLVFGWGIICKENGVEYYDVQADHIPEHVMLEGVTDFMQNSRVAKELHEGDQKGDIVHSFPLTGEIAKALGISTEKTGWLVAMKPTEKSILTKFANGEYKGFSIGGSGMFEVEND